MQNQFRLLITDVDPPRFAERFRHSPEADAFEIVVPEEEGEEALRDCAGGADAILCYKAPLSGAVIRAASGLRLIQKHGRNLRNIDVAAATEQGVPVATCSLLRNASVAEHAMALMLACARRVIPSHRAVSGAAYLDMGLEPVTTTQWETRGNWARIEGLCELFGATVGIVGMGDIGIEIARRCQAFEMKVSYCQRNPHSREMEDAMDIRFLPLDELLTVSDFIVLVLPHTPESQGLIGASQLDRMKSTATIVNVGRGALIDEDALADALRNQKIAMAGLDVYQQEPLPASSALRELQNVVLLPHTGGGSNYWKVDPGSTLVKIRRFFFEGDRSGVINTSGDL
jgi:phosphoglycerate dehydrogenase-like enzyme